MDFECQFSQPVNASGTLPVPGDFWQFQNATCSVPYLSVATDTDAHFYLDERITYGDIFLAAFMLLFLLVGIFWVVWSFIVPKSVKLLTRNDL